MAQQVEALQQFNVHTEVICLRIANQPKVEKSECLTIFRVGRSYSKASFLQYLTGTLRFGFLALSRVILQSFQHCPDVLVVHTLPEALVFTAILPKLMGKSVILDARDLSLELLHSRWSHSPLLRRILQPLFRTMERFSARFSDRIITASTGFQGRLIERSVSRAKIVTIVNSADDRIFKYNSDRCFHPITAGVKLIYHGTVAERFGVVVAVKAIHLLQNSLPNAQLFVYGKYDQYYRKLLEKTIVELDLSKRVFLNGYRPLYWLYEAMKDIDIGVVPYLSDEFMNLALSTKGFEYAAAGLPMVAARLASMQSVFEDDCLSYFEPGDPYDLADKIVDLCFNAKEKGTPGKGSANCLYHCIWEFERETISRARLFAGSQAETVSNG